MRLIELLHSTGGYGTDLREARQGLLYHWVSLHKLKQIFTKDWFEGEWDHRDPLTKKVITGTSMSRNPAYKHTYRSARLVFDEAKLAQRFKIIPLDADYVYTYGVDPDYYSGVAKHLLDMSRTKLSRTYEPDFQFAEEFVLGNIPQTHRYLVAIDLDPDALQLDPDRPYEGDWIPEYMGLARDYSRKYGIPLRLRPEHEFITDKPAQRRPSPAPARAAESINEIVDLGHLYFAKKEPEFPREKSVGIPGQRTMTYDVGPSGTVTKRVWIPDASHPVLSFLHTIRRHPDNPFFPRVFHAKIYKVPEKERLLLVVQMEKLHELDDEHLLDALPHIMRQIGVDLPEKSYQNQIGYVIDIGNLFARPEGRAKLKRASKNPQFVEAMDVLEADLQRYGSDLHGANFMFRLTGHGPQLVIIDPFIPPDAGWRGEEMPSPSTIKEAREAPLYHWMDETKAASVFEYDEISPSWEHVMPNGGQQERQLLGTSMSRNPRFTMQRPIRLTIDQGKLSQTNKIVPVDADYVYNYTMRAQRMSSGSSDADSFGAADDFDDADGYEEASYPRPTRTRGSGSRERGMLYDEEFVLGEIKPLHNYLLAIDLDENLFRMQGQYLVTVQNKIRMYASKYNIPLNTGRYQQFAQRTQQQRAPTQRTAESRRYTKADETPPSAKGLPPDAGWRGEESVRRSNQGALNEAKFRKPIEMYHGTTSKFLRSILKQGVIPHPKEKKWSDDPFVSSYDLSRASLEGSYWTSNLMTARGAALNATGKFGGSSIVVIGRISEGAAFADEDDTTRTILNAVPQTYYELFGRGVVSDAAAKLLAGIYWGSEDQDAHIRWQARGKGKELPKDVRLQDLIADIYIRLVHEQLSSNPSKQPVDKRFLRQVLEDLMERAIAFEKHASSWGNPYVSDYEAKMEKGLAPPLRSIQEIEDELLGLREKLTRMYRKTAYFEPEAYNHTLRTIHPVTFRGANRILAIVGEGNHYRDPLVLYYGNITQEYLRQYHNRIGAFPGAVNPQGQMVMQPEKDGSLD